jgi:hypothetical protein
MPPKDKSAMQWKIEQKPDQNSSDQLREGIIHTEVFGQQVNSGAVEH